MDNLLKQDLTTHYGIPTSTLNICQNTNLGYFEIEDINRVVTISSIVNSGTAKYSNPNNVAADVVDYDGFLTSLPQTFQNGKKRCDVIVYTQNNSHFLLNELKNRIPTNPDVLAGAILQMAATLRVITPVPVINNFINNFGIKRCCYCNKQALPPSNNIIATTAFNRVNGLAQNGLQLSHPDINTFGFELFQYTGLQVISLI